MLISCSFFKHSISLYSQNWIRSFKPHSIFLITKIINFLDFSNNTRCQHRWKYIKVLTEYKLEIQHLIHTKSKKWNQNIVITLVGQKFTFYNIYIIDLYIYMYAKAFLIHFIKA